jgi:hypothetical protein
MQPPCHKNYYMLILDDGNIGIGTPIINSSYQNRFQFRIYYEWNKKVSFGK